MAANRRRSLKPRTATAALLLAATAGCASIPPLEPVPADPDPLAACTALFAHMDREVAAAGTGDARAWRIPDFPWLRADRPLSSFRTEVDDDEHFAAWLARLNEMDRESRAIEVTHLPEPALKRLRSHWHDAAETHSLSLEPMEAADTCRTALNRDLKQDADRRQQLRDSAIVPDEYITWHRIAGIYWLSSRIAAPAIDALHDRLATVYQRDLVSSPDTRRYAVPAAPVADSAAIARAVSRDALGIPQPSPAEEAALFNAHAPVWAVETDSRADRPGALILDRDGRPFADPDRPAEYRHLSWTRMGDEVLLQLNYSIWFPERPPEGWIDLYAGHLDSVTWRTTLAADGSVLAHESIHGCGCYYALFPGADWRIADIPSGSEPVLSPASAPTTGPDERLVIALDAGTHYLAGLTTTTATDNANALAPLPEEMLRMLPLPEGGTASAFEPDGLIPASRRGERFVFWPFGVPSAGASRQHGTHAIAFIGRRHFDDARLLETLLVHTD